MANDKYIELVSNYLSNGSSGSGISGRIASSSGPFTSIINDNVSSGKLVSINSSGVNRAASGSRSLGKIATASASGLDNVAAYSSRNGNGIQVSINSSGANQVASSSRSLGRIAVSEDYLSKASGVIDSYVSQGAEARLADYVGVMSSENRYVALYGVLPVRGGEWTYITGNEGYTLLYGPFIDDRPIALYGVKPTPIPNETYVTLYGPYVPGPNRTTPVQISITEEEIKQNISILKKSANTMENSWEDIKGPILKSIKESWIGKECSEYTSNIEKMNKKVTNSIEALRLLAKKYEDSIDQLTVTRKSIMEAIDNL